MHKFKLSPFRRNNNLLELDHTLNITKIASAVRKYDNLNIDAAAQFLNVVYIFNTWEGDESC